MQSGILNRSTKGTLDLEKGDDMTWHGLDDDGAFSCHQGHVRLHKRGVGVQLRAGTTSTGLALEYDRGFPGALGGF